MTLGIEIRQNKYTGETGIELGYTPNKISEYNYSAQEKRFQYIRNNFPGIYPEDPQNYSLKDHEMNLIDRVENVFSLYGTLGYTFNSRYTFTLNLRNDASNRFGKNTNNRFYPVLDGTYIKKNGFPGKNGLTKLHYAPLMVTKVTLSPTYPRIH